METEKLIRIRNDFDMSSPYIYFNIIDDDRYNEAWDIIDGFLTDIIWDEYVEYNSTKDIYYFAETIKEYLEGEHIRCDYFVSDTNLLKQFGVGD